MTNTTGATAPATASTLGDTMTETITAEQRTAYSLATLREKLPAGSDVYTIVRSVSKSGMSRKISVKIIDAKTREINDITWHVGNLLGYKLDADRHALKVSGAGMDMCFHVVYSLGRVLFPEGAGTGHSATDGGYALNSRIL